MSSALHLLSLTGEIRNHIYLHVALDAPTIRLFEGRVVLPPLASVCRKIRKELEGKYQRDATLNPTTPIHALVTNFNFHPLSRWLDKHSRDLKDKLDVPRVLCITSVLLAPDSAANCSTSKESTKVSAVAPDAVSEASACDAVDHANGILPSKGRQKPRFVKLSVAPGTRPLFGLQLASPARETVSSKAHNPGLEAHLRTLSDEYKNSLRVLEQKLVQWCCTWTSCVPFNDHEKTVHKDRDLWTRIRELRGVRFGGRGDRGGTRYAIAWRARTIHREHPASRKDRPHRLEKTGLCYRGDFCDHFLFNHLCPLLDLAHRFRSSWLHLAEFIRFEISHRHWDQSHRYPHSFQQSHAAKTQGPPLKLALSKCCHPCKEIIAFYQRLDIYNIRNRVFEREALSVWPFEGFLLYLVHGTKRAVPNDFSDESSHYRKRRSVCFRFCNCHDDPNCLHVQMKERLERDFVWDEEDRLLVSKLDHMIGKMKHFRLSD